MTSLDPDQPKRLVPRLLEAGVRAPQVLLEAAVEAQTGSAEKYVEGLRAGNDSSDVEALVDKVIAAHVMLARTEGAAAGMAMSTAEMTTIVGTAGTMTLPAAAVTMTGDLAALAWIQIRMVLIVAGLYGRDLQDKARLKELFTLTGVYGAGSANVAGDAAARGAQRMAKRLVLRHLRGDNLQALKALFRLVGINFARAGVIRALPLANIPMNAVVNDAATRTLGRKARAYYATLPAAGSR